MAVRLPLDSFVDFFAVYGDILGCVDSDSDLITFNAEHCNGHVVSDHDGLADLSGQDKHCRLPRWIQGVGRATRKGSLSGRSLRWNYPDQVQRVTELLVCNSAYLSQSGTPTN